MKFLNPILDAFKEIYTQLINLKIPDFVLLILIVLFLIWLLVVNKKLKRRLSTDIENIKSEIGRIPEEFKQEKIVEIEEKVEEEVEKRAAEKKEEKAPLETEEEKPEIEKSEWHEEKKELEEKIELNDKQIFILLSISNEPARTYEQEKLFDIYKMAFSGSGRTEFDTMIEVLKSHNLIKAAESTSYKDWLEITEKGLQYLEIKRKE